MLGRAVPALALQMPDPGARVQPDDGIVRAVRLRCGLGREFGEGCARGRRRGGVVGEGGSEGDRAGEERCGKEAA